MTVNDLKDKIERLSCVSPGADPWLSWYVDLEDERGVEDALHEGVAKPRQSLGPVARRHLDAAFNACRSHFSRALRPGVRSIAYFASCGKSPWFTALEFNAPLKAMAAIGDRPRIYPLAELLDNYRAFHLLLSYGSEIRLLRIELGAVIQEYPIWSFSALPRSSEVGSRNCRILRRAVSFLSTALQQEQGSQWVLAADGRGEEAVMELIPAQLALRRSATCRVTPGASVAQVVRRAVLAYRQAEEMESQWYAQRVVRGVTRGGDAVAGRNPSRAVLSDGRAHTLVLISGWWRSPDLNPDLREELVRLAGLSDCHVEVVDESPALVRLGGFGCLLNRGPGHQTPLIFR